MSDLEPTRRGTVFVIEDDELIVRALRDMLELRGYQVLAARTLREAAPVLALLDGQCVVLLDPLVPGVTAAAVLRALKEGQALITIAVAVYPRGRRKPPPDGKPRDRRLISPDLLLDMVRQSFATASGRPAEGSAARRRDAGARDATARSGAAQTAGRRRTPAAPRAPRGRPARAPGAAAARRR